MGEILSFEQLHKVIKVKNTKWPEIICNNLMWNLVNIHSCDCLVWLFNEHYFKPYSQLAKSAIKNSNVYSPSRPVVIKGHGSP